MKVSLVPNWKQAGKWWSVRIIAINGFLQLLWETLPADAVAVIPADWRGWIALGLCVLALIARVIDQGLPKDDAK